ncbi:MAG: NAD-dependent epimerase/dehydratase family protein [Bacteroidota bacterium]
MKVIVLGGTGFIGYHTCLQLLQGGHEVASVSFRPQDPKKWFSPEIPMYFHNLFEMSTGALIDIFTGYDAMVYALGPDDRNESFPPAYDFFYEKLVVAPIRIFEAAREAGIQRAVVEGSYFCHFALKRPDLHLDKHAYVNCRLQQREALIATGRGKMDVMVLELPYLFGRMPQRDSQWKELLIRRFHRAPIILYPKGGTVMVTVEDVARATLAALLHGRHGTCYPIGTVNMDWDQMIHIMLEEMGMANKRIIHIPRVFMPLIGWGIKINQRRKGKASGLDPLHLADFMCEYFYYDSWESKEELNYGKEDVVQAIREAVQSSLPL